MHVFNSIINTSYNKTMLSNPNLKPCEKLPNIAIETTSKDNVGGKSYY